MRLFRFDAGTGRPISQFGSVQLALSPIYRDSGQLQIVCMHLGPGGVVGYHQAQPAQLFLVVNGAGWVRGAEGTEPLAIHEGQAAFRESGEWHSSGSDTGMTAIVHRRRDARPRPAHARGVARMM